MSSNRLKTLLCFCFVFFPILLLAIQPKQNPTLLETQEFFVPELYISTANVPIEDIQGNLTNAVAWDDFRTRYGQDFHIYFDPRSNTPSSIIGHVPLIPGSGLDNNISLRDLSSSLGHQVKEVSDNVVVGAVLQFIHENRNVLGIDESQIGKATATKITDHLWQVNITQQQNGIPIRHGRIAATINNGNLILIGTETWGNSVINTTPAIRAEDALTSGFQYAGGQQSNDVILSEPRLEIVPYVSGDLNTSSEERSYRHYLTWIFTFQRAPETPVWEVMVDANDGKVLAFQDTQHYVKQKISGGVYPMTNTEICPTVDTCGVMQSDYPMPFANTGLAAPNNFTNSAGVFDYTSGTVTTTLNGRYVRILDNCGAISESAAGSINLGGVNGQHDCTAAGSAGNTASSRSCFYEVNKLQEVARGWLPNNTWLQNQLTANVNINLTCNAFWSTVNQNVNFYRSGGGCRNTGEIAGVFDHEWGHGLDDNDANGTLSNSSEGYADIAANFRLQASCVGHGFFWTANQGCGQTADGTGFNADEAQVGALHCDLDCSGVRDSDWDKHANHTPDTPQNFVCGRCQASSGPCGRQVHCAAAPVRQAAWDLVSRDLTSAPFSLDTQSAFVVGSKLFYQGSGNVGLWYSCTCPSSSDGCGAAGGYLQWLAADDDDGNLNNGTPHMTAIFNAYSRHNIACGTPSPQNSGCASGPTGSTSVTATPSDHQIALSWNSVPNAAEYWVMRTEGHAACDLGKALIATVTGTTFTDTQVVNARTYYYTIVAAGSNDSCYGPVSNCASATPGGGCTLPGTPTLISPANGATGVSTTPTLDWSDVTGASSYEVQVATDVGFTNVVRSATGLASSQWPVSPALANNTTYFWRARAVNSCGPGSYSATFSFTTQSAPTGDFTIACSPSSLTIPRGSSGTSTCTVTSTGGFNSPVSLDCVGEPTRVTCSFSPNPVTPPANSSVQSTLTINVQSNAKPRTTTFNVVGTSGNLSHSTPITLTVTRR
jgi:hypothetical protein